MFCPRCGQEQISSETRFCSRCGFLMAGVNALLINGGNLPYLRDTTEIKPETPRKRGLKQGLFIFLLTFLVVPLVTILTVFTNSQPFAVIFLAILLPVGGFLRMVYALLFESTNPLENTLEQNVYQSAQGFLSKQTQPDALPPQQSIPVSAYEPPKQGNWRDTNDLTTSSVADRPTKLLGRDE